MIERHNEALQGMDFSEDFEDDFIPLDQFERIEKYRWNPTDPDEERRRYDRYAELTELHHLLL
jgi:hypothetical protein